MAEKLGLKMKCSLKPDAVPTIFPLPVRTPKVARVSAASGCCQGGGSHPDIETGGELAPKISSLKVDTVHVNERAN